jgi:endonuclease-3
MATRSTSRSRPAPRAGHPDARSIVARLSDAYPGATTELHFRDAFELLVATILSAQSTDVRVNMVTPALFARYPDAAALGSADLADVERIIQPTGFFRTKARSIVNMSRRLVEEHGGRVPAVMESLVELPGVGRKTANVVLGHALNVPGLPVDRHVLRVAGRLGIARTTTPEDVEAELCAQLPPELWTLTSDCLILHGRRICRPTPLCEQCTVADQCLYFQKSGAARPGRAARSSAKPARDATRTPATVRASKTTAARPRGAAGAGHGKKRSGT